MSWYFYIISNANHTLYAGMTDDPFSRLEEHKTGRYPNAFTRRYNFDRIVHLEILLDIRAAAKREHQVKGWPRAKKVALIEATNPEWKNLVGENWSEILALR